ncbi:MAG: ABC transporter permease subunit [Lachnospiraceae bacterium]|nr:ABC transporter permease subunit [Lachnospiraceae bacterium]
MKKLLSANYIRLMKSKSLWFYTAAMFGITIWYICIGADTMAIHPAEADAMDYTTFIVGMIPAFLTLFTGFFVGTEYSNKTIRNKLSVGHTRKEVYLSYLFTLYTAMGILFAAWLLGTISAFGVVGAELEGIRFLKIAIAAIFFSAAYAALLLMISITFQSKALAVILEIEFARVSLMIPLMGVVIIENMGMGTKLITFIINCFPMGQWMLSTRLLPVAPMPVSVQLLLSVLLIVSIVLVSIKILKEKELK